jgi:hypothetical protein
MASRLRHTERRLEEQGYFQELDAFGLGYV